MSLILGGRKLDRRTKEAALFKAIEDSIHQELGGLDRLGVAQLSLARRASMLWLQLDLMERAVLEGRKFEGGDYRATSGELRRCLEALGISKTPGPDAPATGAYAAALAGAEGDR
jgi:hypothetical protein